HEYRVVPDVHHPLGMEVYSVDSVNSVDPTTGKTYEYAPFYSFRHGGTRDNTRSFWYSNRRPAPAENDPGTEGYLSLADLDFDAGVAEETALVVRGLCTNRNLPAVLRTAGEDLHFELVKAAPVRATRCLRPPTVPLRPPPRRGLYWRLISHLTSNH